MDFRPDGIVMGDTALSTLERKNTQAYRAKAIAAILQRLDGARIPPQTKSMVQIYCDQAAHDWCSDPDAASE
jgi:hypothetical protein